jgi:hypothetical protein
MPPQLPAETLADINPDQEVTLGQAVGLSANFPFGFRLLTIPRNPGAAAEYQPIDKGWFDTDSVAKLIDGGVVDNTGFDTVSLILKAIEQRALNGQREPGHGDYSAVWKAIRERGLVLIEIDSGSRPVGPGWVTSRLSLAVETMLAFNNATSTDRETVAYLNALRGWLDPPFLGDRLARLEKGAMEGDPDDGKALGRLQSLMREGRGAFRHFKFDCNHWDAKNVMTAWSLAPDDKARLLARFIVECETRLGELEAFHERYKGKDVKQREALNREEADQLVANREAVRAAVRAARLKKIVYTQAPRIFEGFAKADPAHPKGRKRLHAMFTEAAHYGRRAAALAPRVDLNLVFKERRELEASLKKRVEKEKELWGRIDRGGLQAQSDRRAEASRRIYARPPE